MFFLMVFRVVITSNCRFHKNNMTIMNNKRKKFTALYIPCIIYLFILLRKIFLFFKKVLYFWLWLIGQWLPSEPPLWLPYGREGVLPQVFRGGGGGGKK